MLRHRAMPILKSVMPFVTVGVLLFVAGCGEETPSQPTDEMPPVSGYAVVDAFPQLSLSKPVDLRDPGDGSQRLFVADQFGVVHVFENRSDVDTATVFLDLTAEIGAGILDNGEKGLLSIAFDPDFTGNGWFYAYFTSETPLLPGTHDFETRLSRFTVSPPSANVVDPATEEVILNVPQLEDWHNGGQLLFDNDGHLYLGIGDSGHGDQAQDPGNLLGSVIRIDVSSLPYTIPPDNPFPGSEIFAYGFRNPWRMSFDPVTERLWVADVGSNFFEEINLAEAGNNYGWWCREGTQDALIPTCPDDPDYTDPVWFVSHDIATAVIGGSVVRGTALPSLEGRYVFSDFTARQLWALDYDGGTATHEVLIWDTGLNVSSCALDSAGQLYLLEWNFLGGPDHIYKIVEVREEKA